MLDYPLSLLARVLGARLRGSGDAVVRRVVTDSREVQAGDLFVALAGGRYQAIPVNRAHTDGQLVTAPAWPAHPDWMAQFLTVLGSRIEP